MKLSTLLEKHINRKDLVVFLDAFEKEHSPGEHHCLLKAMVEGFKLKHVDIDEGALYDCFKHNDFDGTGADIHPDEVKQALKDKFGVLFDYKFITTTEQAQAALRRKLPLIISIRWSSSYYHAVKILRDGKKDKPADYRYNEYRELGATDEMIKKVQAGIIPYPNETMLDNSKYDPVTHALLCVGYDAADDAFIVRDFNPGKPDYNGFFKLESKLFFDPKLSSDKRISIVEAVITLDVRKA